MAATNESSGYKEDYLKIVVVGHNGSGKSSLIREFVQHDNQEELSSQKHVARTECSVDGLQLVIYDTRGLGDTSVADDWEIMESVVAEVKSANMVLICHKLYGRIDAVTYGDMKILAKALGNELIKQSVFVFTFSDEYRIRHDLDDSLAEKVNEHQKMVESRLKEILTREGLNRNAVNRMPSYRICSVPPIKMDIQIHTIDDLWKLCQTPSYRRARGFASVWNRLPVKTLLGCGILGVVIGGILGATFDARLGAVGGGILGATVGVNAVGTVVGGILGATVGVNAVGTVLGGILGATFGARLGAIVLGAVVGGILGATVGVTGANAVGAVVGGILVATFGARLGAIVLGAVVGGILGATVGVMGANAVGVVVGGILGATVGVIMGANAVEAVVGGILGVILGTALCHKYKKTFGVLSAVVGCVVGVGLACIRAVGLACIRAVGDIAGRFFGTIAVSSINGLAGIS